MRSALQRAFVPDSWLERVFWGLIGVPLVLFAWQAFDRADPATVLERTLLTPEVRPGQLLKIKIKQRQNYAAEVTIYRSLYDGYGYRFDYGVQQSPPKDLQPEFITQIPVLRAASPGAAKLVTTVCWARPFNLAHQVWPICRDTPPTEFTILPVD